MAYYNSAALRGGFSIAPFEGAIGMGSSQIPFDKFVAIGKNAMTQMGPEALESIGRLQVKLAMGNSNKNPYYPASEADMFAMLGAIYELDAIRSQILDARTSQENEMLRYQYARLREEIEDEMLPAPYSKKLFAAVQRATRKASSIPKMALHGILTDRANKWANKTPFFALPRPRRTLRLGRNGPAVNPFSEGASWTTLPTSLAKYYDDRHTKKIKKLNEFLSRRAQTTGKKYRPARLVLWNPQTGAALPVKRGAEDVVAAAVAAADEDGLEPRPSKRMKTEV